MVPRAERGTDPTILVPTTGTSPVVNPDYTIRLAGWPGLSEDQLRRALGELARRDGLNGEGQGQGGGAFSMDGGGECSCGRLGVR